MNNTNQINSIKETMAVIEFEKDGTIKYASQKFLKIMGYSLNEIKGKHHKIFCIDSFVNSIELQQGLYLKGLYERKTKNGQSVWLEATYNPILNCQKQVVGVMKIAQDVTEREQKNQRVTDVVQESKVIVSKNNEESKIANQLALDSADVVTSLVNNVHNGANVILYASSTLINAAAGGTADNPYGKGIALNVGSSATASLFAPR